MDPKVTAPLILILAVGAVLFLLYYDTNRRTKKFEKLAKEYISQHERLIRGLEALTALSLLFTILRGFGLSKEELEDLLGINLKELTSWKENGPPPGVFQKIERYADLLPKLESYVQPGLLPQVIRRHSIGLGGKTILDLLKEGREQEVFEYLERLLEYGSTE